MEKTNVINMVEWLREHSDKLSDKSNSHGYDLRVNVRSQENSKTYEKQKENTRGLKNLAKAIK